MSNKDLQFRKDEWWKVVICILIGCALIFCAIGPHRFKTNTESQKKKVEYIYPEKVEFVRVTTIPANIDMDIIADIESSNNPHTPDSPAGARGLCQIMPNTWKECTERMGVNWSWEVDAFDRDKNLKVGTYYLNTRIPQMIKYYKLKDNYMNRIIAYNWGIGNLKKYIKGDITDLPKETSDYITKYDNKYILKTYPE